MKRVETFDDHFSARKIAVSVMLIALGFGLYGAGIPARAVVQTDGSTQASPELLSVTNTQADFDLLRRALEEAHSGLYRYASKSEMDRMFASNRSRLSRPMTRTEFVPIVAETLAQIRCGHTGMTLDEATQKEIAAARLFPLRIRIEGQRQVVQSNDTPDDQTIKPGAEILEINGKKMSAIVDQLMAGLTGDGDIESGKKAKLQGGFERLYWVNIDKSSTFTVKVKDSSGKIVTSQLAGVLEADRSKNQNPVNADLKTSLTRLDWTTGNLSVRFLKDPDVAEIRIRGFGGNDYPKWTEDTFKMLGEKGTKSLIIDLRGNGGGADMYGAMLVSYLTDKPFRYFDHIDVITINPSFKEYSDWREDEAKLLERMSRNPAGGYLVTPKGHPGVAEQPPSKYPFMGKVFILIDGGTFSTAADFCAVTHHLKRATFIGEETGGGYYGNNSGMQTILTLPNSKFRIRIPMFEYWNAVPGYDGKRRGTKPDHVVETKIANLLRGVDEQLDLAVKLATQN